MEKTYSIKAWQKVLSVFMAVVMATTLWGASAEPAYAATGESGNDLTYDTAIGVFSNHALMTTRTSTSVDGNPSIQTNQAIVSAGGMKSISSEKHQGAGSGANSSVQIAGIMDNGNAVSTTNSQGLFGASEVNGHTIVPVEYVAVAVNNSGGMYYAVKSSGSKMILDCYSVSGKRKQTVEVGNGTPTNVAVYPGYVQVFASMPNPNSTFGGKVNGAKVFAITSDGLTAEPDIVTANANDDSGTVFMKTDGTVWYQPADGTASQIAEGANTSARIEFLQAYYAKIQYPKGESVAYTTTAGAQPGEGENFEGITSAMANRIVDSGGEEGQLNDAQMHLIANINGEQFLWEDGVIVGFTPQNSQGACEFWVYSAVNGKLLNGPVQSSTQVKLERQGGNYAVTYTPANGSQQFAGIYYNANLQLLSKDSAPSRLGGTLLNGLNIQVTEGTNGTYQYYQVTDVYGNPINCGDYTLALGYVEGVETIGIGDATPRVQHANTNLFCAQDIWGNYGAVDSEGNIYVPFQYDNYFDLGFMSADAPLNKSNYVLVHRNGQWFFYDVSNAKEISYPVLEQPVKKRSISKAKVVVRDRAYTGKRLYPKNIKVWYNGKRLVRNRDYKVYYNRGTHVGRYRVTIRGIGKYTGRYRTWFHIVPRTPRLDRFHSYHRAFRVYWHHYTNREYNGYQIRYSRDRNFRHYVHYRYFNRHHRHYYTFRHLRSHTRYYAQVRLYRDVHGKRYYSHWSRMKYVRTR